LEQPSNQGFLRKPWAHGEPAQRLRCGSFEEHNMEDPMGMEIVRRAYELWEQAGMPEGKEQEFYHQAERELRDADKSSPDDL
jgi:hypothetical protein